MSNEALFVQFSTCLLGCTAQTDQSVRLKLKSTD